MFDSTSSILETEDAHAKSLWDDIFTLNQDGEYYVTEDDFNKFVDKWYDSIVSATLANLVKDGLLDMAFNAEHNDFEFKITKKGQEAYNNFPKFDL